MKYRSGVEVERETLSLEKLKIRDRFEEGGYDEIYLEILINHTTQVVRADIFAKVNIDHGVGVSKFAEQSRFSMPIRTFKRLLLEMANVLGFEVVDLNESFEEEIA